jgi:hypothetical protein
MVNKKVNTLMFVLASMCMVMSRGTSELDASEVRDRLERLDAAAQAHITELKGMMEKCPQLSPISTEFLSELQSQYDTAFNAYNQSLDDLQKRFHDKEANYSRELEKILNIRDQIEERQGYTGKAYKRWDRKYLELHDKLQFNCITEKLEDNVYEGYAIRNANFHSDPQNPIQILDSEIKELNEELEEAREEYETKIAEVKDKLNNPYSDLQEPSYYLKNFELHLETAKEHYGESTEKKHLNKYIKEKKELRYEIEKCTKKATSVSERIYYRRVCRLNETHRKLDYLLEKSNKHLKSCKKAVDDF